VVLATLRSAVLLVGRSRGDILGVAGLGCPVVASYLTWGLAAAFWAAGPVLLLVARLYGGARG
jgi:hypothetical protein